MTDRLVYPPDGSAPRPMTDDEIAHETDMMQRAENKSAWMQYSMIAMQVVKMQMDSTATPAMVATKTAAIADAMLAEFQKRFHG